MKRAFTVLALVVMAAFRGVDARVQAQAPYYSVDAERRIEGTIKEVVFEPRYGDRAPFLIVVLEERATAAVYRVEISPAWFFDRDLHKGEKVGLIGSYYLKDGINHLIARQLQAGGETYTLRDSRGFPSWRGGASKGRGWRRGR